MHSFAFITRLKDFIVLARHLVPFLFNYRICYALFKKNYIRFNIAL